MIVCVCRRVSDHDIRRAVGQGCSSFAELQQTLGVAAGCGKCCGCAVQTLQAALMPATPAPKLVMSPRGMLQGEARHA